jgi:protein-disulfide isomerase
MTETPDDGAVKCPNCGALRPGTPTACPACGFLPQPAHTPVYPPAHGYGPVAGYPPPAGPYAGWGSAPPADPNWPQWPAPRKKSNYKQIILIVVIVKFVLIFGSLLLFMGISLLGAYASPTTTVPGGHALPAPVAPGARVLTPEYAVTSGRTIGSPSARHTLDIWVDFQCPACGEFNRDVEPQIMDNYVSTGKARVVFHDYIIIDQVRGGTESLDAANAAMCASDQGQFWKYHDWLFANQYGEGSGAFSKTRLKAIARSAAIVDLNSFNSCVDGGDHNAEVNAEKLPTGAIGTPTLVVDGGTPLASFDYPTVSAALS